MATDSSSIIVGVVAICMSVLGGGVAMAWRMGRIEQSVADLQRRVSDMANELMTGNGISLAALANRAEGRRIAEDVPKEHRTASDQHYVDNLEEGGR